MRPLVAQPHGSGGPTLPPAGGALARDDPDAPATRSVPGQATAARTRTTAGAGGDRLNLDQLLGQAAPDRLALACIAWLLLPGLIFLGGWLQPFAGAATIAAGLGAFAFAPGWRQPWPLPRRRTLACLAGGLAWALLCSGTHHLLHAAADWQIRDAVLHDLTLGGWPVAYSIGEFTWLLRAPLGYYMPAALAGAAFGFAAAQAALFLWTGLGLALVLMLLVLLAERIGSGRAGAVALLVAVFVGFGGLDFIPNLWLDMTEGDGLAAYWGRGGEWWARKFQYSGHVTLLLWAPNHALPAWIPALLLLRHGAAPGFPRGAALPLAAGCFWAPLSAFGAAVLTLAALAGRGVGAALRAPSSWLALVFALPLVLYVTAGSTRIEHGPLFANTPLPQALLIWARFLAVEVLAYAVPVLLLVRGRLLLTSLAFLVLLPLYIFGPGNEMTMRGGIAPLTVLAVAIVAALLGPGRRLLRRVLVGAVVIGMMGQAMEASLLTLEPWPASRDCSLPEAAAQSVFTDTDWSHYVVPWPLPRLARMLAAPEDRQIGPETVSRCWPEGGP